MMAMSTENLTSAHLQAHEVLAALQSQELLPSPRNYTVWYAYRSGSHPELSRSIDDILRSKKNFDEQTCGQLYRRFFSLADLEEALTDASERMSSELCDVRTALSGMRGQSDVYDELLSSSVAQLQELDGAEGASPVLDALIAATRQMGNRHEELAQRLVLAQREIGELRESLQAARSDALTDPLTQVENRRSFDTNLGRLIDEAAAQRSPLSLLLCDVDHFKNFNDAHGHDTGDQVLRFVAETLKRCTKGRDVVARFGGEEFVVLLPTTVAKNAELVAREICREIAGKELVRKRDGQRLGRITISIGATEHEPGETPESLLQRADAALYSAKRGGRNRVCIS